jgi:hypothetical protein
VPLFRFVTGTPVTPVAREISGISVAMRERQVGTAAPPLVGPDSTQLATCGVIVKVNKGVEVDEVTAAEK